MSNCIRTVEAVHRSSPSHTQRTVQSFNIISQNRTNRWWFNWPSNRNTCSVAQQWRSSLQSGHVFIFLKKNKVKLANGRWISHTRGNNAERLVLSDCTREILWFSEHTHIKIKPNLWALKNALKTPHSFSRYISWINQWRLRWSEQNRGGRRNDSSLNKHLSNLI